MTSEQILAVGKLERLFPGSKNDLWKGENIGNVFHGEYQILSKSKRGHAVFMLDAADRLMELWRVGVIEPLWFRPSHSRCGFLGLASHGVSAYGPNGNDKSKSNCEVAADWTWEVKVVHSGQRRCVMNLMITRILLLISNSVLVALIGTEFIQSDTFFRIIEGCLVGYIIYWYKRSP